MAYETLIVEIEDHIAQIRLNRPDAKNALNKKMLGELADTLAAVDRNDKVRCVLLSGSEKCFSAGVEVAELADASFSELYCGGYFGPEAEPLINCRKPVVAAVAGYSVGAGCELAMMCDVVIAADTAKFGLPDVNLGVIPALGGTQRLARAVGKAKAMDMLLTGRVPVRRGGRQGRPCQPCRAGQETAGRGPCRRLADRREVDRQHPCGQGSGRPQLRDLAARGAAV